MNQSGSELAKGSVEAVLDSEGSAGSGSEKMEPVGKATLLLSVAVPFVLAACLYLSFLFAVFAMLPLLYSQFRFGRVLAAGAAAVNLAIVWLIAGRTNAAIFFVAAIIPAIVFSECVRLRMKVNPSVALTVLFMILASVFLLVGYSVHFHANPIEQFRSVISLVVDQVVANVEKYRAAGTISSRDIEKFVMDPEMTKRTILFEFPGAVVTLFLLMVVVNFLLAIRLNLRGLQESMSINNQFFKNWKAPEHLIWPTLVSAAFLVIDIPNVSDWALNLFKVFMAVYALQGLAITGFLFDVWGVRGFLRGLGYVISVALLLPLVISLGFFDLWFGFREKFRSAVR